MLYSERKYILKLISLIILLSIYSFITSIYGQDYPDEFLNGEIHKIQSEILNHQKRYKFPQ